MVKFELGGEEEKRDRREWRGGEVDGTIAMDSSVSSSVSWRVQRPTVPAFTQLTISSKCLHAYSRVCLMEHSYLVPVHCHMGIIFHYQPWGLELFWLTLGFGALLADLRLLLMKKFSLASTVLFYGGKHYNQGIATHFFPVHLGWIYSRSALEQLKLLSSVKRS